MSYEGPHPFPVKSGGSGSASLTGVLSGNGTTPFTASAVTQFNVLVGGASNAITSIAPSATSGVALISQGAASNPAFGTVVVAGGGTGATSLTAHSVLIGAGTSSIVQVGPVASTGCLLASNGVGSDPGFTTATYPLTTTINQILYSSAANTVTGLTTANNGLLVTSNTGVPSILAGPGTTGNILQSNAAAAPSFSTATYPSTAGTAGKVLISDGTNIVSSTPTFPNASATSGKFIRSDGTNWIASTPTLPTTAGTSGKVLQSDGTNYVESTPTYPSTSGSSGKILISDGTNNVYSTPTYPNSATGTGTILRADGTNWVATTATYPTTTSANTMMISTSANVVTTTTFIEATSFTPTLAFGGGSTGITYTTQLGRYQRIGNKVTFSIDITLSSKGSSTGNATITLPVTAAAGVPTVECFLMLLTATTTGTYTSFDIAASGTTGLIVQVAATTGTATALTDTAFNNTSVIRTSGSYWV